MLRKFSYQNHLNYGLSRVWNFNFRQQCNISTHGKHIKYSMFLTCIIIIFMVTFISSTITKIHRLKNIGIFVKVLLILITWYPLKKH